MTCVAISYPFYVYIEFFIKDPYYHCSDVAIRCFQSTDLVAVSQQIYNYQIVSGTDSLLAVPISSIRLASYALYFEPRMVKDLLHAEPFHRVGS